MNIHGKFFIIYHHFKAYYINGGAAAFTRKLDVRYNFFRGA